jgi:phosphatidylserine/phosphatidylglycerophosphate/cardiolipin synthase-like enzyme
VRLRSLVPVLVLASLVAAPVLATGSLVGTPAADFGTPNVDGDVATVGVDGEQRPAAADGPEAIAQTDSPNRQDRASGRIRSTANASIRIAAVYPNPYADGDAGEYVRVVVRTTSAHTQRLANATLSDGETTVGLAAVIDANVTEPQSILISPDPETARRHYRNATTPTGANANDLRVLEAPDLGLSNSGERIRVRADTGDGSAVVATAAYQSAPEGELYRRSSFVPLGATSHPANAVADVDATAFVLPDTKVPLDAIRNAADHVMLAGYTFASERVARALERAAHRGVDVRVLVDADPVGGLTQRQVDVLDALAETNVTVRALGGRRARYEFQHAKYLVADGTGLVLTENWKPSGTGGHANRGWGVALEDPRVAADLERVFESDWTASDAIPWRRAAATATPEPGGGANGTYPSRIAPRNLTPESVTVIAAPDNAERELRNLLRNATDRVRVIQMSAARDGVLVAEAIAAARRGVDVDILLSSAWYAREENQRLVDALESLAERDDIPLEARLVDPNGRFQKVHAKGVVVDDQVVVGSINWNDHSLRENREVAVVLEGDAVATYYADAFAADWRAGDDGGVPRWLAAAGVLAGVVLLGLLASRVDFE